MFEDVIKHVKWILDWRSGTPFSLAFANRHPIIFCRFGAFRIASLDTRIATIWSSVKSEDVSLPAICLTDKEVTSAPLTVPCELRCSHAQGDEFTSQKRRFCRYTMYSKKRDRSVYVEYVCMFVVKLYGIMRVNE